MVNLGLAGFVSIGAYASGLLTTVLGWPVPLAILAAMVVGLMSGVALTYVTLRLRDDYLAIVTLGFAEVVRLAIVNELWLTHGSDGISGIPGIVAREHGYGFELGHLGAGPRGRRCSAIGWRIGSGRRPMAASCAPFATIRRAPRSPART